MLSLNLLHTADREFCNYLTKLGCFKEKYKSQIITEH